MTAVEQIVDAVKRLSPEEMADFMLRYKELRAREDAYDTAIANARRGDKMLSLEDAKRMILGE